MFKYQIKLAIRNLNNSKVTSGINLVSIVIGLSVSILLLLFVKSEWETNQFITDKEHIYQITKHNDGEYNSKPKIDVFKQEIFEAEAITYFTNDWSNSNLAKYNNNTYELQNVWNADSSFFKVFQFECIYGDASSALNEPGSIVLTESESKRIFGDMNPVGTSFELISSEFEFKTYTISAVIADLPHNSSFRFGSVISMESFLEVEWYAQNANHWGTHNYLAFMRLKPKVEPRLVSEKMNAALVKHAPQWTIDTKNPYNLTPLSEVYFNQGNDGMLQRGHKGLVMLMGAIGILILSIACINYMNLTKTRFKQRYIEFGIKKTIGAGAKNLMGQSLLETGLLFSIAFLLVWLVLVYVLPLFGTEMNASLASSGMASGSSIVLVIIIAVVSLIIFGVLPALSINRASAIALLHKSESKKTQGWLGGYTWVIFQFTISIALIATTFMLQKQTRFMMHSDYGFQQDKIIQLSLNQDFNDKHELFKQDINKLAQVEKSCFTQGTPGQIGSLWGLEYIDKKERRHIDFHVMHADADFFELFDVKIIQGRLPQQSELNKQKVLFNETFAEKYQISDFQGARISIGNKQDGEVLGIMQDFHYRNYRESIMPFGIITTSAGDNLFIRLNTQNLAQTKSTITEIEKLWNNYSENFPFEYRFLDEQLQAMYSRELNMMRTFMIASILAIFIACIGLFGIAYHIVEIRTKEVGIRKVNGAQTIDIILLLNKEFLIRVFISILIATPLSLYGIERWLENYAYQTTISWWIFALAGGIASLFAVLAVCFQSYMVANRNPVESLKYE